MNVREKKRKEKKKKSKFFFFKQKTAYEIKECDWSSDVCSSDLHTMSVHKITQSQDYNKSNTGWTRKIGKVKMIKKERRKINKELRDGK